MILALALTAYTLIILFVICLCKMAARADRGSRIKR
jgi:hypothetical protein